VRTGPGSRSRSIRRQRRPAFAPVAKTRRAVRRERAPLVGRAPPRATAPTIDVGLPDPDHAVVAARRIADTSPWDERAVTATALQGGRALRAVAAGNRTRAPAVDELLRAVSNAVEAGRDRALPSEARQARAVGRESTLLPDFAAAGAGTATIDVGFVAVAESVVAAVEHAASSDARPGATLFVEVAGRLFAIAVTLRTGRTTRSQAVTGRTVFVDEALVAQIAASEAVESARPDAARRLALPDDTGVRGAVCVALATCREGARPFAAPPAVDVGFSVVELGVLADERIERLGQRGRRRRAGTSQDRREHRGDGRCTTKATFLRAHSTHRKPTSGMRALGDALVREVAVRPEGLKVVHEPPRTTRALAPQLLCPYGQ
jgi:hypothetical protein